MPVQKRYKTKYPGVYYIVGKSVVSNQEEKIYYVMYRKDGKQIHEKAGRQEKDDMTPAKAAHLRAEKIKGHLPTNEGKRQLIEAEKKAEEGKWTISKLWKEYKKQKSDIKGLKQDSYRYEKYLEPIGNKEPKDFIQLDVDRMRVNLLKKKKPQTVKHVLSLLKRIVHFGENKGLCEGMCFKIQMPKVNNAVTEDLTPKQLSVLLKVIDDDANEQAKAMMKMALYSGLRRGEILKLKWDDIDFQRGFISIRDPKGGADQKIPLNDYSRRLLESVPKTKSIYVFPGPEGNQKPVMNRLFTNRIKKKAKLPEGFRPMHGLRHVYASMLASSGKVDMYSLQKLLTHKDPRMTQRYAHLRDEAMKRASDVTDDILSSISSIKEDEKVINLK
jgi:integrase